MCEAEGSEQAHHKQEQERAGISFVYSFPQSAEIHVLVHALITIDWLHLHFKPGCPLS